MCSVKTSSTDLSCCMCCVIVISPITAVQPPPSLTYLAAAAAAITCVAAVPFLGLQLLGIVTIVASVDEALRCYADVSTAVDGQTVRRLRAGPLLTACLVVGAAT